MVNKEMVERAVKDFLLAIGEDINREGLKETPQRIAKMCNEIFAGLDESPEKYIKTFDSNGDNGLVLIKDISIYSVCEHHLMPFYGKASIAYIPNNGKVLGLSKVARIVDHFSKKPQIQERLGEEICDFLFKYLNAKGVVAVIQAEHLCMTMRGVRKPGTNTVTVTRKGCFENDNSELSNILSLLEK